MSYNTGVMVLVLSNPPCATRTADLQLLARWLPELYFTHSYPLLMTRDHWATYEQFIPSSNLGGFVTELVRDTVKQSLTGSPKTIENFQLLGLLWVATVSYDRLALTCHLFAGEYGKADWSGFPFLRSSLDASRTHQNANKRSDWVPVYSFEMWLLSRLLTIGFSHNMTSKSLVF